tara:strand:- start:611 stop:979 length:369 start_codon:yes stop_codon:yes gene_type:complete
VLGSNRLRQTKKLFTMADEKIFADGFVFKRNENAPDFVVGRISIKVEEAIAFIKQHQKNGWVNLGVKTARSGNYYIDLDTFEATKDSAVEKKETKNRPIPKMNGDMANQFNESQEFDDDLPF